MSTYSGNNTQSRGPLIVLNSKHMDEDKNDIAPHFVKSEKQPNGNWEVIGQCTGFTGRLIRVSPEVKEIKKDGKVVGTKEMVKLLVASDDSDETYLLSLTYRISTRDLFNTILNIEDTAAPIDVSYTRNKGGFEKFWLKQNGKNIHGKYPYEELAAKVKKLVVNKQNITDSGELNDFLRDELKAFNERLSKAPAPAPVKQEYKQVEQDEDEIPF